LFLAHKKTKAAMGTFKTAPSGDFGAHGPHLPTYHATTPSAPGSVSGRPATRCANGFAAIEAHLEQLRKLFADGMRQRPPAAGRPAQFAYTPPFGLTKQTMILNAVRPSMVEAKSIMHAVDAVAALRTQARMA
jgi:hypothetical protein